MAAMLVLVKPEQQPKHRFWNAVLIKSRLLLTVVHLYDDLMSRLYCCYPAGEPWVDVSWMVSQTWSIGSLPIPLLKLISHSSSSAPLYSLHPVVSPYTGAGCATTTNVRDVRLLHTRPHLPSANAPKATLSECMQGWELLLCGPSKNICFQS